MIAYSSIVISVRRLIIVQIIDNLHKPSFNETFGIPNCIFSEMPTLTEDEIDEFSLHGLLLTNELEIQLIIPSETQTICPYPKYPYAFELTYTIAGHHHNIDIYFDYVHNTITFGPITYSCRISDQ